MPEMQRHDLPLSFYQFFRALNKDLISSFSLFGVYLVYNSDYFVIVQYYYKDSAVIISVFKLTSLKLQKSRMNVTICMPYT